ncbi:AMP-dependent synthetase/ligase [Macrophomina phaseolina MS6]|uniref:AMP-dependent synthetase/ligase n=1 Tax=Macrophomina phaseolina (strain MS6) TaxID=1126212 RepID=K2RBX9_MACPH|nr:AMP-dependent synthetase/ligase [Macrophomina phaseolina MS6]
MHPRLMATYDSNSDCKGFGLVAPALSLGCGKTFTALPSFTVPNGPSTVELINLTNARSLMSVPTILEDICQLPHTHGIEALRRLDFVGCGGGPLKRVTGECLAAAGVRVVNSFGTTETGPLSVMFVPGPDYDWHFFRMRTDLNIELIRVPGSKREDDAAAAKQYHLRVVPPGWTTPFDVQDQLVTNPRHSMTDFRPVGRSDDLIVLATGEKVLASALAAAISEAENVGAVAVFGEGQPQVGVLVEAAPASLAENVDHFKSLIWPHIESVNDRMDEHARILSRDLVVMVPSGLSLPRSDKGAVLGKEACALFEHEISDAYRRLDDGAVADDIGLVFSVENLKAGLVDMVLHRLKWKTKPQALAPDADLFELGMDSVQATHLRRLILAAAREIPNAAQTVGRDFVYLHPSVAQMADALKHGGDDATVRPGQRQVLESFVNKYTANEPRCVVFLTGSTGSLGTHLLAHLAGLPEVSKIVCYNRPSRTSVHPKDRLQKALTEKRIDISQAHWEKISVLEGRASQPRLDLDEDTYFSLCCTVTHIVHNAWPMDFRRPLASFEPQFAALRNLLELAKSAAARHPGPLSVAASRFLFVSSIAVVGNYAATHGGRLVPETSVDAESCIGSLGYGQAKFVCEKIIEQSEAAGVETMYVRVGQMSGSSKSGYWNTEEHFPALLRTAQQLGTLPVIPGTFSWLPADYAAAAIAELALSAKLVYGAYQLENPIRQSWHDLMQDLTPQLGLSHLNHVPYADWLAQLRDLPDMDAEESPAKKLEAFFERDFVRMSGGEVVMDTSRMRAVSGTLRSMDAISPKLIERYVAYWRSIAFLA